jgi:hypothetical protein
MTYNGSIDESGILVSMELESDRIEIALRMLSSGRYIWTITTNNKTGDVELLKSIDSKLKDAFPFHVTIGTGRAQNLSEE